MDQIPVPLISRTFFDARTRAALVRLTFLHDGKFLALLTVSIFDPDSFQHAPARGVIQFLLQIEITIAVWSFRYFVSRVIDSEANIVQLLLPLFPTVAEAVRMASSTCFFPRRPYLIGAQTLYFVPAFLEASGLSH